MSKIAVFLVPCYHSVDPAQERLYCLNYQNSRGELSSTRFIYDGKGLNTRSFYQQIMGGRSSRNLHQFDKKRRIIRTIREYNDGETSEELFRYDGKGRLTEETFTGASGEPGVTTYIYDKEGNASVMECRLYKGWLDGRLEFTFDGNGRRKKGTLRKESGPEGEITYEYDANGNLILEKWSVGRDWNQIFQFVYEPVD